MPKPSTLIIILFISYCANLNAQIQFADESFQLNYETMDSSGATQIVNHGFNSIIAMGITDMNNDLHDDIVILNYEGCQTMSLNVMYQIRKSSAGKPQFSRSKYFDDIGLMKAMTIGDTDADGQLEIFSGGKHIDAKLFSLGGGGTTTPALSVHRSHFYLQGCNFIDIDHDGDIDLFAANDDHISEVLVNNGGVFSSDFSMLKPEAPIQTCTPAYIAHSSNAKFFDPNSGNYGSVFADIDFDESIGQLSPELYVSKCKGGTYANSSQGCTINLLYQRQPNGSYQEVAPTWNLNDHLQSWAADFGDINNDGKLDAVIINHYAGAQNLRLLKNDGSTFNEIYSANIPNSFQVIMEDFNNDGYLDIIVTNPYSCRLFQNNTDETFTNVSNWIDEATDINSPHYGNDYKFISCATGDLDQDGYIDFYADYHNSTAANPLNDVLYINQGSGNYFLKVKLTGNQLNPFGIGARIHLTDHTPGGLGTQVREVRAGESYGIVCSLIQHFGLASNTDLSNFTLKVFWPSGTTSTINGTDLSLNQINIVNE